MSKHTPTLTDWEACTDKDLVYIKAEPLGLIAYMGHDDPWAGDLHRTHAAHIVSRLNAHDALVAALDNLLLVMKLGLHQPYITDAQDQARAALALAEEEEG